MQLTSTKLWLVKWYNKLFASAVFPFLSVFAQTNPFSWWNQASVFSRSVDRGALACSLPFEAWWSKKRERKVHVNSKTFGRHRFSCGRDPTVLQLTHICFSDVTGNMITQENKKRQLSSKLAQNMHLSVFNIIISKCLGKCTNSPLTLFLLFSSIHKCMLGYSCMFFFLYSVAHNSLTKFHEMRSLKGRLRNVNRDADITSLYHDRILWQFLYVYKISGVGEKCLCSWTVIGVYIYSNFPPPVACSHTDSFDWDFGSLAPTQWRGMEFSLQCSPQKFNRHMPCQKECPCCYRSSTDLAVSSFYWSYLLQKK